MEYYPLYLTELRKIGLQPMPQRLKMAGRLCVLEGKTGDLQACGRGGGGAGVTSSKRLDNWRGQVKQSI